MATFLLEVHIFWKIRNHEFPTIRYMYMLADVVLKVPHGVTQDQPPNGGWASRQDLTEILLPAWPAAITS